MVNDWTADRGRVAAGSSVFQHNQEGIMGVRRRLAIAAGAIIASLGIPFATAAAASASPAPPPTPGAVYGVITGLHTFTLDPGYVVVVGELLRPDTPGYFSDIPVVGVSTSSTGVITVTTVTTGYTYLPLNRPNEQTKFFVISIPTTPTPPPTPPTPPTPPWGW
jgi:hypothetical protein